MAAPARRAPFVLAAIGLAGAASSCLAADRELLRRGERIASQNCGACHAIGRSGASQNPKSPPFRFLSRRYPLFDLEEALGEGIVVGHEGAEMPQFSFDTAQIEALLAYLGSIQKR
jgi:cytochrome c